MSVMKKALHYVLGNILCVKCDCVLNNKKRYVVNKKFYCDKCRGE